MIQCITGMSSLVSSVIGNKPDFRWKLSSIVGIITGALVGYQQLGGRTGKALTEEELRPIRTSDAYWFLMLA